MTALVLAFALLLQEDDRGFLGLHEADMSIGDPDGPFHLLISGILDFEYYAFQEDAPGLLFYDEDAGYTANPRATFFFDLTLGERVFAFMQARGDRGLDPNERGTRGEYDGRIDELFVRWTFHESDTASGAVQAGKFATPLGNFVPRHDSMRNPFVRAPIAYDHVTTVGDHANGPKSPPGVAALVARRDLDDLKDRWATMIWGPVYHYGVMVSGTLGRLDGRAAFVNAAPCERPEEWDSQPADLGLYNVSGRIGWNPFIGCRVGVNASYGPYLSERVEDAGIDQEDFNQALVGLDLEYAIGHLQVFAEVYRSMWEVPGVHGRFTAVSAYIEGKYSLGSLLPGLCVCARVGQIAADDVDAGGRSTPWERTSRRAEVGAGWRAYLNLLLKAQVEVNHTNGPNDPRDDMVSMSVSLSF